MSRPASHNRRPWFDACGSYNENDSFSVSSEAQFFFQLWQKGHWYERLRRDIMPGVLTPPVNAMKRMQVLERFEWLVKRAEREERAA